MTSTPAVKLGDRYRDTYYDRHYAKLPAHRKTPGRVPGRIIEVMEVTDVGVLARTIIDGSGTPTPNGRKTRISFATLASGYEPVPTTEEPAQ